MLRYSIDKNFEHCFAYLEKIFDAIKKSPKHVLKLTRAMEFENWQVVKAHYEPLLRCILV